MKFFPTLRAPFVENFDQITYSNRSTPSQPQQELAGLILHGFQMKRPRGLPINSLELLKLLQTPNLPS